MFGFLKKKLKSAISIFSKKVEEKAEETATPEDNVEAAIEKKKEDRKKKEVKEKPKKEVKEKKEKVKEEKVKAKPKKEEPIPEPIPEPEPKEEPEPKKEEPIPEPEPKKEEPEPIEEEIPVLEEKPVKKGIFGKIREKFTTTKINTSQFEEIFDEMEFALLENNVAVEVIDKIKHDLEKELVGNPIPRMKVEETIRKTLKKSVEELFTAKPFSIIEKVKEKKPYVICFIGVNGSGKTTTIAKVAQMLLDNKMSPVLAAADTFRAAAIDQLQIHADKLGVKLIKHDYGSDAAAVAFDAVAHAKSKGKDVVLIDTAGRMHSNTNLMDEMKKIVRVAKPDLIIFIGESITGNDCVEQAKSFGEAVDIDGIILSKADIDEKGGAAISVSYVTGKPILYLGVGQEYKDLKPFDSSVVIDGMGI
jgi:fused signal recognition particle receptor